MLHRGKYERLRLQPRNSLMALELVAVKFFLLMELSMSLLKIPLAEM